MLSFVLDLNWGRFSIDQQVIEANAFMESMTEELGVSRQVLFNSASLGSGEHVLPFFEGKRKDLPNDDTLSYLRWHHQQVRQSLLSDRGVKLNHELREMILVLQRMGHVVVAAEPDRTVALESKLQDARCRGSFGERVVGTDRATGGLVDLYRTAAELAKMPLNKTLIVSDDPEHISTVTHSLPVQACVGVVWATDEMDDQGLQDEKIRDLRTAGAGVTLTGGYAVPALASAVGRLNNDHQRDDSTLEALKRHYPGFNLVY